MIWYREALIRLLQVSYQISVEFLRVVIGVLILDCGNTGLTNAINVITKHSLLSDNCFSVQRKKMDLSVNITSQSRQESHIMLKRKFDLRLLFKKLLLKTITIHVYKGKDKIVLVLNETTPYGKAH